MNIEVVERKSGTTVKEKVYGDFWLNLFYNNNAGRKFLDSVYVQKGLSKVYGVFQSSTYSRSLVDNFIHNFHIKMENFEMPIGGYQNFNEFFIRKKKKWKTLFPKNPQHLGSPCDARVFAAKIENGEAVLSIKGKSIKLSDLIGEESLNSEYSGGSVLVFRLCPVDYHRFHFFDDGEVSKSKKLGGKLHSVNPISLEKVEGVFLENEREICLFKTKNFGNVFYLEVGALCVGKIVQTHVDCKNIKRGDEKGFFSFGASTVILVLNNRVKIDEDFFKNSTNNMETLVEVGEKIAESI